MVTSEKDIILDPRISSRLLSTFASCCKGDLVVDGQTFLSNDMGKDIFSKNINIIDDPTMKDMVKSRNFDGEGMSTKKMHLVKDGTLSNWLLDLKSARKLSLKTNANAVRSSSSISPAASNVYIEAGTQSPEQIISNIKDGIYITDTFGHGINTITGDYSQGTMGILIKDGKITDIPVNNFTIAGKMQNIFSSLIAANDLEFRYSTNAPTLYIGKMMAAA